MPFVQVTLVEGRSMQQKHALIAAVTEAIVTSLNTPADRVRVAIYEVSQDEWGIGGVPYSITRGTPTPPTPPA